MHFPVEDISESTKDGWASRNAVAGAGSFAALLGLAVATAWMAHAESVNTVFPGIFNLKFNTALGFVGSGFGLIGISQRNKRIAEVCGAFVLILGIATLIEYLTGTSLGLDQVCVADFYTPNIPYPGRPAPNTAVTFVLAAIAILWTTSQNRLSAVRVPALELLGFLVFSLGAEGMLGHLQAVGLAYTWGSYTQMSVFTSAGFLALGLGLMAVVWQPGGKSQESHPTRIPLWLPALLCFLVLMLDIGTPNGIAAGIAYVPLIFCSLWFSRPHTAFVFAIAATLLTMLAFFAKVSSVVPVWMVIMNRVLTACALWFTATLVYLRRRTEQALRESELRDATARKEAQEKTTLLVSIVESSDDAILAKKLDGTILSWNRGAERIFGYKAEEIVGQKVTRLIPDEMHADEEYILGQLKLGRSIDHFETVRLHKDGRRLNISLTISPIHDQDGKVIGASKIARDITERKLAEERFHLVVEAAPSSMVMADRTGKILLVNRKTEEMFGYRRNEILDQSIECLIPERFRAAHPGDVASFFSDPQSRAMGAGRDLFGRRKDGTEIPLEIGLNPIETPQGILTLASILDISLRKKAEEELRRKTEDLMRSNQDLEQFAYVASHDLQEPLRAVAGCVQLLQQRYKGQMDARADEFIAHAVDGTSRMQALIEDLLSYSRVSRAENPLKPVDIGFALDIALRNLSTAIQESGMEIT
ncbi:MAG TPA: PAS domain S-box protein, partial [Terracidiphilus sp.]|nr:PAS domain S-box protein [Terracidiphilus sp.]